MYSGFVLGIAAVVGGLAFFLGFSILRRFNWVLGWLRGTVGLVFVGIAIASAVVALDMNSYKKLMVEQPLATLTFTKTAEQKYAVEVSMVLENSTQTYELNGDQWQMDARIVRWKGIMVTVGAKPGFRLDRLSGRYYSLEDERRKKRTVYELKSSKYGVDFWSFLHDNDELIPLVEAVYGSAAYLPMADKAIFQVSLSRSGLTAEPINDPAKIAVDSWK